MEPEPSISNVLAAYPIGDSAARVERVTWGGFSGARVWRLETSIGPMCLRRWPAEHPSRERLEFIQAVLWHVSRYGFCKVPAPIETRDRAGYVFEAGRFWELTPWLSGRADYREAPSRPKLQAALTALAGFHVAAATFPLSEPRLTPSPALADRTRRLTWLLGGGCDTLRAASTGAGGWPELRSRAQRLVRLFWAAARPVERMLVDAARLPAPVQPAIRDIWREHVLFTGAEVTGLVDFGALRTECVAADLARLLGSLVGDDPAGWEAGLAAYESVRRLTSMERRLIAAFDQSGVLLSGLQWLSWIYLDRRTFADHAAVESRLDETIARLEHLAGRAT